MAGDRNHLRAETIEETEKSSVGCLQSKNRPVRVFNHFLEKRSIFTKKWQDLHSALNDRERHSLAQILRLESMSTTFRSIRGFFHSKSQQISGAFDLALATAQFCAIMHCLREYVFDFTLCSGPSMLPTLGVQGNIGESPPQESLHI
jgi:hypothetical protein